MKRIFAASAAVVAAVLLLAGCATTNVGANSDAPKSVNLTNSTEVNALCGDTAKEMLDYVTAAVKAKPDSGQRHALTSYGIADPTDKKVTTEVIGALKVRANTDCQKGVELASTAKEAGKVGVENHDGSVVNLPLVSGTGDPIVIDSTTQAATPPLLDGSLRFTAQTLSWAGLVERVGNQQWFKDGVNARAAQTGFTWNDVLKFASANKVENGKVQGVNALAIQVFNQPNLTDEQVRDQVRKYITPDVEKVIGITVDQLPIQRINNGFVNTRNAGTVQSPKMGDYFDTEQMVRVSLMPIKFNDKGEAVGLDGSRGAGIFIDCGNLHWVPKAVWTCASNSSCEKPECPAGTVGVPPNCSVPQVCIWNHNLPPDSPNCLQPKNWSQSPQNNGWVPLGPGKLTDGKQSQHQKDSGETSGNVIDNKVPSGTKSGDTTPDLPDGTVTAPGANSNTGSDGKPVENTQDDVVQPNSNQDDGGTNGDTEISDPG